MQCIFLNSLLYCPLGEIGGNLGLFLGASVVTVFEVLDLIFYSIALRQAAKQDTKKRTNQPQASGDSVPNAPDTENGESSLENPALQASDAHTDRVLSEQLP